MSFSVTEEQQQLESSVQRMLAEANNFDVRRTRLRTVKPDRMALWPQIAELGVIAAAFGEAHHGFAGDPRTVAVVLSALGESLVVEPYLASAVIAGRILQSSTSGFASRLIEKSIAGQSVCVLAHDSGMDPFSLPSVTLSRSDIGWVLEGTLRCVRHADVASSFLVAAVGESGVTIHHIPRDAAGLALHCYRLIDGAGAGRAQIAFYPHGPRVAPRIRR